MEYLSWVVTGVRAGKYVLYYLTRLIVPPTMLQYQMGFQRMYFKVVSSELWSNDNMIKKSKQWSNEQASTNSLNKLKE